MTPFDDEWKKKFLTMRSGREFILYAGLLDLGHVKGLLSIRTQFHQIPDAENGQTAICTAEVTMEGGKVFTGIGDASPKNVAPAMQTCLIRMAETRAKARALRDAVNVGTAAFEELGNEEDDHTANTAPVKPVQPTKPHQAGKTLPPTVSLAEANPPLQIVEAKKPSDEAQEALARKAREQFGFTGTTPKHTGMLVIELLSGKPEKWDSATYIAAFRQADGWFAECVNAVNAVIADPPLLEVESEDRTAEAMAR